MQKNMRSTFFLIGSVASLCFLIFYLYWSALWAGLVWDDGVLVVQYELLNAEKWFANSFGREYLTASYYRPLPLVTMIMGGLWGEGGLPFVAHLINLIVFCVNMSLVMGLVWSLSSRSWGAATVAGILYSVHPAMLEAVSWMSGRSDLLVTFFILLALFCDLKFKSNTILRFASICICFCGAALSKEMAALFPAIFFVWRIYIENARLNSPRKLLLWFKQDYNWLLFLLLVLVGVGYLMLRYSMLGHILVSRDMFVNDPRDIGGWGNHTLLITKTFLWFIILQVFPHYDLSAAYPTEYPVLLNDVEGWLGLVALLGVLGLTFYSKLNFRVRCGLLIMMLLFFPVSNVMPLIAHNNFINLRFLMLPISLAIVLFVPLLVPVFANFERRLKLSCVGGAVLWCFLSVLNLSVTIPLWSQDRYLWQWVTETKPDAQGAWYNYAKALADVDDQYGCIEIAKKSLVLDGSDPKAYILLARCYLALGEYDLAQLYANRTLNTKLHRDTDVYASFLTVYAQINMSKVKDVSELGQEEYANAVLLLEGAVYISKTNMFSPLLLAALYSANEKQALLVELVELIVSRTNYSLGAIEKTVEEFDFLLSKHKSNLLNVLADVHGRSPFDKGKGKHIENLWRVKNVVFSEPSNNDALIELMILYALDGNEGLLLRTIEQMFSRDMAGELIVTQARLSGLFNDEHLAMIASMITKVYEQGINKE